MRPSRAALAALILFLCAAARAQEPGTLTLDQAFARLAARHPDLARYRHLRDRAEAERDMAAQRAPLRAELQLENALGTGAAQEFEQAEISFGIASVLEGDKPEARRSVAESELQALELEQQAQRLDLFAEAARRYLDVLAARALGELADAELAQRQHTLDAAAQRVRAGASPDSARLAADAALARARLQREQAAASLRAAALRLSILWNQREPDFGRVAGDPLALAEVPPFAALAQLLERSPELSRFADEQRLREARVQLARSARQPDIEWQAGIRRLEESDDWAAVAGVSMALGARRRAEPGLRAAQADLAALSLERESRQIALYATLADAHARLDAATRDVASFRGDVLPRLHKAGQAAERAFRAGALTYLEWSQVQADVSAARREQLQAAIAAHRALIEIQRLTAQPFTTSPATGEETRP